jgi:hypothetical protein
MHALCPPPYDPPMTPPDPWEGMVASLTGVAVPAKKALDFWDLLLKTGV